MKLRGVLEVCIHYDPMGFKWWDYHSSSIGSQVEYLYFDYKWYCCITFLWWVIYIEKL